MPRFTTIQQRFTQGELDPVMLARADIEQYYGALATAKDILTLPQGGFKRRPGLEHIDRVLGGTLTKIAGGAITETAPNGGTAGNATDQNSSTSLTTTTNISTTNGYVVAHYDLITVQNIGVIYLNGFALTSASSSEWFLQVSINNAAWVTVGEALDVTAIAKDFTRRVHSPLYRYVRLVRIGTTDLGTDKATLTGLDVATETGVSASRCIDFQFNVLQTYKMVVTDKNIAIYQGTTYLIDIYMPDLTEARLPAIDWEADADTLIIYHEDVDTLNLVRTGANDVWVPGTVGWTHIPIHAFTGAVITEPAFTLGITSGGFTAEGATVKLTSAAGFNSAGYLGQYIELLGTRRGRFFVTEYIDSSNIEALVIIEPDATSSAVSGVWHLENGYEEIWSVARGYPRHGRFYQGRLWVDGGKSRPSVAYGSVVNNFFDFEFGNALDDQAIGPLSGSFNDIEAIYPGRNLMFFSSNEEYIIPQAFGDALTPLTSVLTRQSSLGSESGFRPQEIEGGVMYVQREGASIQEFIFNDTSQAFTNNFVSLLSSHLIADPVDFALRKATNTEDGAYLLLVKGDGNLTICNILRSQGITSFVEAQTTGRFKSCGVDVEDMYFVVRRTINSIEADYLERFNNDHFMDASTRVVTGLPTDTFTGLDHLEGEECRVLADGALQPNKTPVSGSVTIGRDAEDSFEIGLNFSPIVTDLPAEVQLPGMSTIMGRKTNISEISLRLKDTAGILVNGKLVSFRGFGPAGGGSPFDIAPILFTGVKRLLGWKGWKEDAQVTITQVDPLPMTVLAIKKRINT